MSATDVIHAIEVLRAANVSYNPPIESIKNREEYAHLFDADLFFGLCEDLDAQPERYEFAPGSTVKYTIKVGDMKYVAFLTPTDAKAFEGLTK